MTRSQCSTQIYDLHRVATSQLHTVQEQQTNNAHCLNIIMLSYRKMLVSVSCVISSHSRSGERMSPPTNTIYRNNGSVQSYSWGAYRDLSWPREIWHDDVMIWKRCRHYWPFVRGIIGHQWIPLKKCQQDGRRFKIPWINSWVAGDMWRHTAHVTSRQCFFVQFWCITWILLSLST